MKFSIIIPAYNQAQYLSECIESALNQTRKADEIIVVNDGSSDETRYVAQSYPITYVEQVNKGLSSARNTGIMNSTVSGSDYIYPLDSDDKMAENCLEKVEKKAIETNADVIAPSFQCFGKFSDKVILMDDPKLEDFKPLDFKTPQNRVGYFSAIKKGALLEIGGYSPRMIHGWEDYHLWINLLTRGKKIVTLKDVLMYYRTKEESMITEANKHASELMAQIYKDFPSLK